MAPKATKNDTKGVEGALARAVSGKGVRKDAVSSIAKSLNFGKRIRGIDPCIYGICFDFVIDPDELFDLLQGAGPFGPVRVFPHGIPIPDLFHVQIEKAFTEIPRG